MSTKVNFLAMKTAVEARLASMMKQNGVLLVADVSKEQLWNTYLSSFPEGTNPIYKTRTEHDCNCCRQFVTNVGNLVTIKDGVVTTIWDILVKDGFQQVANALSQLVKNASIVSSFHADPSFCKFGNNQTKQTIAPNSTVTWNHFFANMSSYASADFAARIGLAKSDVQLFQRGLDTISSDSIETVIELIEQNSLYRGSEFKNNLQQFKKLQKQYVESQNKNLFLWETMASHIKDTGFRNSIMGIRNTVIGTLLIDISEGEKELDACVRAYETKVAPQNYQRPTAIVTKRMIDDAREKINQLGLQNALVRRYACLTDLNINDMLFVDRGIKPEITMDVFDVISQEAGQKATKTSKNIEEVSIEDFVSKILPSAKKLELLFEQKHQTNLVSLITAVDPTAPALFSWNNNFSWSYNGGVADSIKERVKAQGGTVQGDLRVSLSWFNHDDLDLSVIEPKGNYRIYFGQRKSPHTGGTLDVDMNAGRGTSRNAVENIIYSDRAKMYTGNYEVWVHNFCLRETQDVGFVVEIEFDGQVHTLQYDKRIDNGVHIKLCDVQYDAKTQQFQIINNIVPVSGTGANGKEVELWNIKTANFHRVNAVMLSPNFWNDGGKGNKHYMFMLDQCRNDESARGMYNEFLRGDLKEHRKVLEMVGCKMSTERSESQLSGLGFSATKKDSFVCRVTGAFERTLKVTI